MAYVYISRKEELGVTHATDSRWPTSGGVVLRTRSSAKGQSVADYAAVKTPTNRLAEFYNRRLLFHCRQ